MPKILDAEIPEMTGTSMPQMPFKK